MSELGGLKGGKQFSAYQAFIESVKRGEKAIVFGPCYVVLSRNKFDELTQHNYQKDADPRVEGWQRRVKIIEDMRLASQAVDESEAPEVYQAAMFALAGISRQFLRELPAPTSPRETGGR